MDLKLNNLPNLEHVTNITRVEYIESTGTQYIDTGITFYKAYGIYADFQYTDLTQQQCVFGCSGRRANNANAIQIALYINSSDKYACYKDDTSGAAITEVGSSITADLYRHTVNFNVLNDNTFNIDTESAITIHTGGGNPSAHTIPIFCKATLTSMSNFASVRIYAFKMYNNGNLIRDFVPAYDEYFRPCLYDTINHVCYYNQGSGEFILGPEVESGGLPILQKITSLYIKDCPNINGLTLLGNINIIQRDLQTKLSRIRLDVGNITKGVSELCEFLSYNGFNDNYEEQTKPRLVGTCIISEYWTDDDFDYLQSAFDGLTINYDLDKNVNTLLENNELAVQTLDSTKPNYNPAVAIILNNNNFGHLINNPINQGEGKYFLEKSEAAVITGLSNYFLNKSTVTDTNNIVSPNSGTTQTYDFSNFDEFNLFTGLTTIPGGAAAGVSGFSGCSKLTALDIPSNITSMAGYSMPNCSALQSISIPKECTSIGSGAFANDSALTSVYYDGTVENWMNITFGNDYANPLTYAHNLYINNELLTSLSIPNTLTSIKANVFSGASCLSGSVVIPNSVTSIGASAFKNCSSLTSLTIPSSVTSIGDYAFVGCSGLSGDITVPSTITSINLSRNFYGLSHISNFTYLATQTLTKITLNGTGNGTGVLYTKGGLDTAPGGTGGGLGNFKEYIIFGDVTSASAYPAGAPATSVWRIKGKISKSNTYTNQFGGTFGTATPAFIECSNATITNRAFVTATTTRRYIFFFRRTSVIETTPTLMSMGYCTMAYVGTGSSRAEDEAILALYLADTNWSEQSAKLATWYDYNGQYKWYYIIDDLQHCTNTNPDAWPHITRGNSYETTIVAGDGYTLDTVAVTMLDTDTTSPTYDTFVDITNDVYNSSTGVISIPSVTGNVKITAVAV